MNDKFLVVRGLGDRYSSAQLNSVGMPSPESDRRSVPLDLFSTSLISGIDVAKSYRPVFQVLSEEEMLISEQNYILLKQFIK